MLVLSRKPGESLFVFPPHGEPIEVAVLRVAGHVSLGIVAPPEVKILRSELLERPEPQPAQTKTPAAA